MGYGDIHPITPVGRIITGLTSLAGISVIAIEPSLIETGFDEAITKGKNESEDNEQ